MELMLFLMESSILGWKKQKKISNNEHCYDEIEVD